MNTTQAQQKALGDALVAHVDRLEFEKCNMRLQSDIKPKRSYISSGAGCSRSHSLLPSIPNYCRKVPATYTQEFWATVSIHSHLSDSRQEFEDLPLKHDILNFIRDLGHSGDIIYLIDEDFMFQIKNKEAKKTNKMSYPRHEKTQVYGTILPKELTNQTMSESKAYKTYYPFASGEKTPKPKYVQKKANSDALPKQKLVQATKGTRLKTEAKVDKSDKKKQPAKKPKAKGLSVLSEVALTKAEQLNKDEDKDDVNDSDDISDEGDDDNDSNNGNDGDDDANDDDKQESDDKNDDDEETNSNRTELDKIKIPILDQSTTEFYEEEEKINDEETMDKEEDDVVTKKLYDDVNSGFEQEEEDAHVTLTPVLDIQKADEPVQSSYVSSDFTSKLLNLENPSLADNEIASLLDITVCHETTIPEITSSFTTPTPPPPPFFNPLSQKATPTPTSTASETTTSLLALLDFDYVFKFNERVSNLEKDLSEMKQVDQYAKALSSIPAIMDRYIDNKLGKAINKAIQTHNFDCREEAQTENREYIKFINSMRGRDDKDKDQDPSARSDRGTSRRKSSKEAEPSIDSRSSTRSRVDMGNNDEQLDDIEVTKADWFKKPERPPTPDPD
nr:hypothetical protein [Tanacetum cinerariifolium]